jgi:uncharacterized protein YndB with AHSA1/START domain
MNSSDKTIRSQTDAVAFEWEVPHAPEKVWRALTDPALLTQWMMPVDQLTLEPGATFSLQIPPQPGWTGTVQCRFVEIEAERKVSYTWSVPPLETVVTFTLTPTESGTHVSLLQSGFTPDQARNFGGARYGWRMMGDKLVELLARMS